MIVNPGIEPGQFVSQPELVSRLRADYGLAGKKIILSFGRLVKRKGFDKMISAMPAILIHQPDCYYLIGGSGPDDDYLKQTAAGLPEHLRSHVIFLGRLSEEAKMAWLEACDFFAMPSRNIDGDYEGFGIVYLDANLAGKPVLAGDSGGVAEAVANDINGILVDPDNVAEIAQACLLLLADPDLRRILGQQGRERALQSFNWEKQINALYRFITR